MTQVLIATALWLAVIGLIILRGHGAADRSTINATAAVGVGLSLNISPLYMTVDAWLGRHNLTGLIANIAIIFGMSSLARAVARASSEQIWLSKLVLGPRELGSPWPSPSLPSQPSRSRRSRWKERPPAS